MCIDLNVSSAILKWILSLILSVCPSVRLSASVCDDVQIVHCAKRYILQASAKVSE